MVKKPCYRKTTMYDMFLLKLNENLQKYKRTLL